MNRGRDSFIVTNACRFCGSFAWSCADCGATAAGFRGAAGPGNSVRDTVKRGRALTTGELSALLSVCLWKGTAGGVRDAAMIAVLCVAELHRGELSQLKLDDLKEGPLTLSIRAHKGLPHREAALDGAAADILMSWVALRGGEPGRLFLPMDHTGKRIVGERVPPANITGVLRRRSDLAGIEPVKVVDLHAPPLKALLSERAVIPGGDGDPSIASSVARVSVPPQLVAAARALAAWRPPDPAGPGPLDELATNELERLGGRIDGILARRAVADETDEEASNKEEAPGDLWRSIYQALAAGTPKADVARLFKQELAVVIRKTHVPGLMDVAPAGRRLVTAWAKQVLESDLSARPFATASERRDHLADVCGVRVDESTISRHIRSLGYTRVAGRYVRSSEDIAQQQRLTPTQRTRRKQGPRTEGRVP